MNLFYVEIALFIITCVLIIIANLRMRKIFFYLEKNHPAELKEYNLEKTNAFGRWANPSTKWKLQNLFWTYLFTNNFPEDENLKREIKTMRIFSITAIILLICMIAIPFIVSAI